MNLHQPNANEALQTKNRSRNVAPQSGICSRCLDGCKGNCDLFKATFRGRELLYPSPFGELTAGADKDYPVDYSHLNIMGYALGAARHRTQTPITPHFPTSTRRPPSASTNKVKMKIPMFTGALGSTEIARKNWEHFAIGAAISWDHAGLRRKRLRHRSQAGARQQRQGEGVPGHASAGSRSTAATTRVTAISLCR